MNKVLAGIALIAITATSSFAQYCGAPLADNIAPKEVGTFGVDVMFMNQKDTEGSLTARGKYTLFSGFNIFGDVGMIGFDDLALQAGVLYTLPLELAVDLGIRATIGTTFGDWDANSYSITAVTGYTIPSLAWLSVYAQIGIGSFDSKNVDSETGLLGTIGAMFNYDEDISMFVELGTNEALKLDRDMFLAVGLGFNL